MKEKISVVDDTFGYLIFFSRNPKRRKGNKVGSGGTSSVTTEITSLS